MKQVVQDRPDIAFYIKMLPLVKIHPQAYGKAKAIVCDKSVRALERAFDGFADEPTCEAPEVDATIAFAEKTGITGTPAIVLPDGGILDGFKEAAELIRLIDEAGGRGKQGAPSLGSHPSQGLAVAAPPLSTGVTNAPSAPPAAPLKR